MTTTDPAARLRAATAEHIAQGRLSAPEYAEADVTAVLDKLERLRAEREGWFNGAAQRLRHAYRSGWDDRGEATAAALGSIGGFMEAEKRAAAYAVEWWGTPGVWPLPPEQPQAERDADVRAVAAFLASDKLGPAMAALHDHFAERIATLEGAKACPCGCPRPGIPDMCCCPEPCPCGADCGFCSAPPGA